MNWTGKISSTFINRGKLTSLILIALFIWGVGSFFITPKQYNPTITAPSFQIVVEFPGATKSEVLEQVTKPLENIVSDISQVEDVYSVTSHGGVAIVNVNFFVGESFDRAKITLSDRIKSNMDLAPLGIPAPMISSVDPDDVPVVTIALKSDLLDAIDLRKFGFKLRDRLRTVDGVSNINVIGGRNRELSILVDQHKLSKYAINLNQLEQALRANNIFSPSGVIKGKSEYIQLEAVGTVTSPKELEDIVVVSSDSVSIRLKDFATIVEGPAEVEKYTRHIIKTDSGNKVYDDVVLLSLAKLKGTNISDVTERVSKELESLHRHFIPKEIKANVIVDDGVVASEEITGLLINLATAISIVVLVLLLFLDFKAALLVAISIPLTLSSVFGIALIAGENINRITLFALILSLGLLVDNATVVIENIVRHMGLKQGRTDYKLIAAQAVDEVGPGLFMSTVTTVLAFIPMAFVTGMMGPYMGPIPFFVPVALVVALLISLSINPWMASVMIRPSGNSSRKLKLLNTLAKYGAAFISWYKGALRYLLDSKRRQSLFLVVVLVALLATLTFPAFKLVKFRMLPKADVEQFFVYVDLPAGSSLERTLEVSRKIEAELLSEENVVMAQSYIGLPPILDFNGLFRGVSSRNRFNQATIRVGLVHSDKRDIKSEEIVLNLRPRLNARIKELLPDTPVKLKLVEDPPGPPVMSTLLVRVQGWNEGIIEQVANEFYPKVQTVDEVVDTDISIPESSKTIQVAIDHYAASKSKVTPAQIVSTLNSLYSGKIVGIYHNRNNIEQEYIKLRFDRKFRLDAKALDKIFVRNELRISVPLSKLVTIKEVDTKAPLYRENRKSTVYLYGDMGDRSVTYASIDILMDLFSFTPKKGEWKRTKFNLLGAEYQRADGAVVAINIGGEWELTLEVFRDLGLAMFVAIFIIYFILVAQFSSFGDPLIIMSTIPLSVLGVFPGFMVLGYTSGIYFTATSMIGIIALAGIAVNNSIILLEYLNLTLKKGIELKDALVEVCATRLRPILLTTITTILGSLTIVGDPVWAGLAYAIVFGLGMSSALILFVFPTIYYYFKN